MANEYGKRLFPEGKNPAIWAHRHGQRMRSHAPVTLVENPHAIVPHPFLESVILGNPFVLRHRLAQTRHLSSVIVAHVEKSMTLARDVSDPYHKTWTGEQQAFDKKQRRTDPDKESSVTFPVNS